MPSLGKSVGNVATLAVTLFLTQMSFASGQSLQRMQGVPVHPMPSVIHFQFRGVNENVWLIGSNRTDLKVLGGSLSVPTLGPDKEVIYSIKRSVSIVSRGTKIEYANSRVSINGVAMGAARNAVVNQDGTVRMGAFLSDAQ